MTARISSIQTDNLSSVATPSIWSPSWVQVRIVEAYRIERRLPGGRAKPPSGPWPAIQHEFSDKVYWLDARERVFDAWAATPGSVFASELKRMDQAHSWLSLLSALPLERTCLAQWAAAIAYRRSLRQILRRRGWSRTTFYRYVSTGSFVIAERLNGDGVEVS